MITFHQMKLRLPGALKQLIEEAALEENRSLNGEIVSRLEASFPDYTPAPVTRRGPRHDTLETRVRALEQKLKQLIPDYPAADKIEALEKKMAVLEKLLKGHIPMA